MRSLERALAGSALFLASGVACAQGLQWVPRDSTATLVPAGFVDSETVYVCRANMGSGVVALGKFATRGGQAGQCRIALGGREQAVGNFDVLAEAPNANAAYVWVPGRAMSYPLHAVAAGRATDGQPWMVCGAWNSSERSVNPGYLYDENCIYALDGQERKSDTYLVLAANDPAIATTTEAQPSLEGFDPGAILRARGVAEFCERREGLCAPVLPPSF